MPAMDGMTLAEQVGVARRQLAMLRAAHGEITALNVASVYSPATYQLLTGYVGTEMQKAQARLHALERGLGDAELVVRREVGYESD